MSCLPDANSKDSFPPPSGVWVVIAAFNEDQAINQVISGLRPLGFNVVIVDDGSDMPLADFLNDESVIVCRHIVNLGQGAALQTGISCALMHGASYIVTFDADGQHSAHDIPRLLRPLAAGECEVVLGSRFMEGAAVENISFKKLVTLKCAICFTNVLTGLKLSDTHNGLRALTRAAASRIVITQNRMSHATQILQEIARQQISYQEAPVTIRYTDYSVRKGQRISNAFNIFWDSLTEILRA